jgi:hypothetical protein
MTALILKRTSASRPSGEWNMACLPTVRLSAGFMKVHAALAAARLAGRSAAARG